MSLTLKQRLDWVKALGYVYHPSIALSDQMMCLNLQFARNEQYKLDLRVNEQNYRKTATVADADNLPDDFVMYADNAYYTNSGTVTPLKLIQIESLPGVKVNSCIKGFASQPVIYFANQKINTYPASITGITFEYYWKPDDLFDPVTPKADNTTDNMPAYTEPNIIRGAAERNLLMLMTRDQAMQLMQEKAINVAQINDAFYKLVAEVSQTDMRSNPR